MAKFKKGDRVYYKFTNHTRLQNIEILPRGLSGVYGTFERYLSESRTPDKGIMCEVHFDRLKRMQGTYDGFLELAQRTCSVTGALTDQFSEIGGLVYSIEYLEGLITDG